MSDHVDNWLAAWVRGELSPQREERLHEHVEECRECAEKFERAREDFSLMATRGDAPSPSEGLRDRILEDAEPGARFLDLTDEVADLLDISENQTRELFEAVDDDSNWVPFPGHDISFLYFPFVGIEPGEDVDANFQIVLRVESGETFPEHRHLGEERIFMLQGTMLEDDGEVFDRGEYIDHDDDTEHSFSVPEDSPDLIGIVLVEEGIEVGGIPIGSSPP